MTKRSMLTSVLLAGLLAGCGPSPEPPVSAGPEASAESPQTVEAIDPPEEGTAAERLWAKLEQLAAPPRYPEQWAEVAPTAEALNQWKLDEGARNLQAAEVARKYYTEHPQDGRAEEARAWEYEQLNAAFALGQTNAEARLVELENARLADPNVPEAVKIQLRIQQLHRLVQGRRQDGVEPALETMERGVRELRMEFPGRPEAGNLMLTVARGWLENGDSVRSLALVRDVLSGNPEGDLRELALSLQRQLERIGQPLELSFTAVDGRVVDLAALRGKVVLIDFWATWCAPCMAAMPELRQLYEEFRPKGLEIIGISFDQDREQLEKIVTQEALVWPHYFEESKSGNQFGLKFQINGIPAVWLVDKQGRLRDLNGRQQLRSKLQDLLAE